jgi:hypothetical protein
LKAGVKDKIRKLRQIPPPILISECAIRVCEDRRRAPVGGRQPSAECGCRFRLEKRPEQSKPVSVHRRGVAAAVLGEIRSLDRVVSLERAVAW